MFKRLARQIFFRDKSTKEAPEQPRQEDKKMLPAEWELPQLAYDIFLEKVFAQITSVLEDINREGYIVGLDVKDPTIHPALTTGQLSLKVTGAFILTDGGQEQRISLAINTHDVRGMYNPRLEFWLVYPTATSSFNIVDASNHRTWKNWPSNMDGKEVLFADGLSVTIRTLTTEPSQVTKFRGFKLVPFIDGGPG